MDRQLFRAAVRLRSILGVAILAFVALCGYSEWILCMVHWNPVVPASDIVGEWRYGQSHLYLYPGGASYWTRGTGRAGVGWGRWVLDDWNLSIGGRPMRVIRFGSQLRIIRPSGPDTWDEDLGYRKVGSLRRTPRSVPGSSTSGPGREPGASANKVAPIVKTGDPAK